MAKTEVYSWRVDPALKRELETIARAEKTSVGALVDRACRSWLENSDVHALARETSQQRRRQALAEIIGSARAHHSAEQPTPSATNSNLRKAFSQKLAGEQKRRNRPAG